MALLSLYVLFSPAQRGPQPFEGSDRVVHLVLFLLLAATTRWRFGTRPAWLVLLAGYAVLSEVVQGVALAGRSGDAADAVADLLGVALGWVAAARLPRRAGRAG